MSRRPSIYLYLISTSITLRRRSQLRMAPPSATWCGLGMVGSGDSILCTSAVVILIAFSFRRLFVSIVLLPGAAPAARGRAQWGDRRYIHRVFSQGTRTSEKPSLVDIACDHVIREKKASRRTPISCSIYMRIHRLQAFFEFYTSDVRDGEREGVLEGL